MKARNTGAVIANFRAAGTRCVIVPGVVEAACGVRADMIPQNGELAQQLSKGSGIELDARPSAARPGH